MDFNWLQSGNPESPALCDVLVGRCVLCRCQHQTYTRTLLTSATGRHIWFSLAKGKEEEQHTMFRRILQMVRETVKAVLLFH